jgi:hypothetical protein
MCLVRFRATTNKEYLESGVGYKIYGKTENGFYYSLHPALGTVIGKLHTMAAATNALDYSGPQDIGFHILPSLEDTKKVKESYRPAHGDNLYIVKVRYHNTTYIGMTEWFFGSHLDGPSYATPTEVAQTMTLLEEVES